MRSSVCQGPICCMALFVAAFAAGLCCGHILMFDRLLMPEKSTPRTLAYLTCYRIYRSGLCSGAEASLILMRSTPCRSKGSFDLSRCSTGKSTASTATRLWSVSIHSSFACQKTFDSREISLRLARISVVVANETCCWKGPTSSSTLMPCTPMCSSCL